MVRAAVLGVAAAEATRSSILVAGIAGLVAGAMSMAVGDWVSVSSQRDAELADIARETAELAESAAIYVKRGPDAPPAQQVAQALSAHDRLGTHLRDELGLDPTALARPFQAAWISALSFAAVPIAALLVAPASLRTPAIATLGAFGAQLGGAPKARASLRVTLGGALAMTVTALIGWLIGTSVAWTASAVAAPHRRGTRAAADDRAEALLSQHWESVAVPQGSSGTGIRATLVVPAGHGNGWRALSLVHEVPLARDAQVHALQ